MGSSHHERYRMEIMLPVGSPTLLTKRLLQSTFSSLEALWLVTDDAVIFQVMTKLVFEEFDLYSRP